MTQSLHNNKDCRHKRLMLLCAGILYAVASSAALLSPEEALTRAAEALAEHSGPKAAAFLSTRGEARAFLAFPQDSNSPALYLFTAPADDRPYLLAPADSEAPALAGFGSLGSDLQPPPNFLNWLEGYARELEWMKHHPQASTKAPLRSADLTSVEPLLHTVWGQDAPYNDLCPLLSGRPTATGCVATAAAQVMARWQWPQRGEGQFSYDWWPGQTKLSFDYADYEPQWEQMLPAYSPSASDYTPQQAQAVAELMLACGIGVEMDYYWGDEGGSGAVTVLTGRMLLDNFRYAPSLRYVERDFYSAWGDWDTLIHSELEAGRPVIYGGASYIDGGHQFVCDGYADGYFHINWGWDGRADGYFLLSLLDPDDTGEGFIRGQDCFIGVMPPASYDGYPVDPYIVSEGNLTVSLEGAAEGPPSTAEVSWTDARAMMCGHNWVDVEATPGLRLESPSGTVYYLASDTGLLFPALTPRLGFKPYHSYSVPLERAERQLPDGSLEKTALPGGPYTASAAVRCGRRWWPVYPNPRYTHTVELDMPAISGIPTIAPSAEASLEIYGADGRFVGSFADKSIIPALPKGIYVVKQGSDVHKIIF